MFCAYTSTREPRALSTIALRSVNGTQIATSTPSSADTRGSNAWMYSSACSCVLYIFQFPATSGVRVVSGVGGIAGAGAPPLTLNRPPRRLPAPGRPAGRCPRPAPASRRRPSTGGRPCPPCRTAQAPPPSPPLRHPAPPSPLPPPPPPPPPAPPPTGSLATPPMGPFQKIVPARAISCA